MAPPQCKGTWIRAFAGMTAGVRSYGAVAASLGP